MTIGIWIWEWSNKGVDQSLWLIPSDIKFWRRNWGFRWQTDIVWYPFVKSLQDCIQGPPVSRVYLKSLAYECLSQQPDHFYVFSGFEATAIRQSLRKEKGDTHLRNISLPWRKMLWFRWSVEQPFECNRQTRLLLSSREKSPSHVCQREEGSVLLSRKKFILRFDRLFRPLVVSPSNWESKSSVIHDVCFLCSISLMEKTFLEAIQSLSKTCKNCLVQMSFSNVCLYLYNKFDREWCNFLFFAKKE